MPELSNLRLRDVVDFCYRHRRGDIFKDWTYEQIAFRVKQAAERKTMFVYVVDDEIKAFIQWCPGVDSDGKEYIYIENVLSLVPGIFQIFYNYAKKLNIRTNYFVGHRGRRYVKYEVHDESSDGASTHLSI